MNRLLSFAFVILLFSLFHHSSQALAQGGLMTDTIRTSAGELKITFVGHASLVFVFDGKVIHIDPDSHLADYTHLPKADLILITHEHSDHCDPDAIQIISKVDTVIVTNEACEAGEKDRVVMHNGDVKTIKGFKIQAVPAYNIVHMRSEGIPYHPKGDGNGYVVTFADKKIYIAGDTENIPDMKELNGIDIAFLPMNLPYTMTPQMVAEAARSFNPVVLYPYHFGETDTSIIQKLLADSGIEVRIRDLQ